MSAEFFKALDKLCVEHGVTLKVDDEHFYALAQMQIGKERISFLEVGLTTTEPRWAVGPSGGYGSLRHPKQAIERD